MHRRILCFFLITIFLTELYTPSHGGLCSDRHVISATGVGKRKIRPSIAKIRLAVRGEGPTAQLAKKATMLRGARVVNYIRSIRATHLSTTGVQLYPTYNYSSTPRKIAGYIASSTLSFDVAAPRAASTLDGSVGAGATAISSVSFRAPKRAAAVARRRAIRDAVLRARSEARTAVFALGRVIGAPVHVKITDSFIAQPIDAPGLARGFGAARSRFARNSMPFIAGDQTVRAYVSVTFSTY